MSTSCEIVIASAYFVVWPCCVNSPASASRILKLQAYTIILGGNGVLQRKYEYFIKSQTEITTGENQITEH